MIWVQIDESQIGFYPTPHLLREVRKEPFEFLIRWNQAGLQDGASPVMEEFIFFHDFAILVLIFIISVVGMVLISLLMGRFINLNLLEGQVIEFIWTLFPATILIQIAIPSLLLLYIIDERVHNSITVKTVGHQWYWRYEYSDFWALQNPLEFDSYINQCSNVVARLLDTDNRLVLPYRTHIRLLVTAGDVLHSWALPSLGVKADACPGRLNQVKLFSHRGGLFFGQCSEICGANHRFIPISAEIISPQDFSKWVESWLEG